MNTDPSQHLTPEDVDLLSPLHGRQVSFHFPGETQPDVGVGHFQLQCRGSHTTACILFDVSGNSQGIHTIELTLPRQWTSRWMIPAEHQPLLAARFLSDESALYQLQAQGLPMAKHQDERLYATEQAYLRRCAALHYPQNKPLHPTRLPLPV